MTVRIPKTKEQLLEACETHLIMLNQALSLYPSQRYQYKHIAAELRVLVCDFSRNKPLLLDLMDEYGFSYEIKPEGKNLVPLANWQEDTLFEKNIYEPVGQLLSEGKIGEAEEILSKNRKPIPLRLFVKNGLAVFIKPHNISYQVLIKSIAEQEGSSHEDRDLDEIVYQLKSIRIGGEESHIASLISFAELINKVGLDFFNFLFDKIQYKPKHLQISF